MPKRKHEDIVPSFIGGGAAKAAEAEVPVKKQRKSRTTSTRSPIGESSLELLPTEILQDIILRLNEEDYLVVKHVSKTLYRATKREDGTHLMDVPRLLKTKMQTLKARLARLPMFASLSLETQGAHKDRATILKLPFRVERRVLKDKPLKDVKVLLCWSCRRFKSRGLNGFDDDNWTILQMNRNKCIQCIGKCATKTPARFHAGFEVLQDPMFRCCACTSVKHLAEARVRDGGAGLVQEFKTHKHTSTAARLCAECYDKTGYAYNRNTTRTYVDMGSIESPSIWKETYLRR